MITAVALEMTESGWMLIGLIVSTILPLVVGLVTTRVTSGGIKAVLLLALNAVIGFGTALLSAHDQGLGFDVLPAVYTWITFFLVGVGTHFGFWKPTGVSGTMQDVGNSAR